jgi:aldehyde dehydrogenase (NAD+)
MTSFAIETDQLRDQIGTIFTAQRNHAPQMALTTARERMERIRRIQSWIITNEADIAQAMYADFKKPTSEALLGDLGAVHYEIKYMLKHLKSWLKPQPVPTPLSLIGTRSYVRHEPKGTMLIIAPWNYPFGLVIKPLVTAIAAGNVCILKPSEMTPHTATLLKQMIAELFPTEEVAVCEGDANVATALLELPFNHIFFTGSPAVGKIVMAAAAKNLTSVSLELGGKSPCIIDESADIQASAERVAWGKFFNNGQTCIAPDYVLVHESVKTPFIEAFRRSVQAMYSPDGNPIEASDSYCRLVNNRHFRRVQRLINDAVEQGATVTMGGKMKEADNFIEPTVLENLTDDMAVMNEEIFGPVLPVLSYSTNDEVLKTINSREKPLALYIMSRNQKNIDYLMARTSAGDSVINELMFQFAHIDLPFGGVNNSGIGKTNGFYGFQEFSNMRGVIQRDFGTSKFIYPPYTDLVKKLVAFVVRKM